MKSTNAEPARKAQKGMIYTLLDKLKIKDLKADLVYQYTAMRTEHTSDMTMDEAAELIKHLHGQLEDKVKPVRNKIIHYLCLYGMTTPQEKPDYNRINEFVTNIGARNPNKRKLFDLWPEEAIAVLNQVEVMVKKTLKKRSTPQT